jgi:hypothetical protein
LRGHHAKSGLVLQGFCAQGRRLAGQLPEVIDVEAAAFNDTLEGSSRNRLVPVHCDNHLTTIRKGFNYCDEECNLHVLSSVYMLSALLHGKLSREQENMEDILTSIVFDVLRDLSPEQGVLPFLRQARGDSHNNPFAGLTGAKTEFRMWPSYREKNCNSCQPDVDILIAWPDGRNTLVCIEAKYLSGKSSMEDDGVVYHQEQPEPPIDQLAREWQNLASIAANGKAEPVLIYLTAHVGYPSQDIEASKTAFSKKCPDAKLAFSCLWLSWRHLHRITAHSDVEVLKRLNQVLEKLNLKFFDGIQFEAIGYIDWQFAAVPARARKASGVAKSIAASSYNFSFATMEPIEWRFSP